MLNERNPWDVSEKVDVTIRDTKIIEIDPNKIDEEKIKFCAECIKNGGLVCFPTETVYGLGANAFNGKAVADIFKAKGRPNDNPLIVHIHDYSMLELVSAADERQNERLLKLGDKFWPGPLTIIVDKDSSIPDEVSCGLTTVGIRMPESLIARKLIEYSGVPIAAPSANLSGKPSPSTAEHVIRDLYGRVDIIIAGGDARVGVESTVLDVTGDVPNILRPGAITLQDVQDTLGAGSLTDWKKPISDKPKSPGMKYTHYSPNADVTIYDGGNLSEVRNEMLKVAKEHEKYGNIVGVLTTDDGVDMFSDYKVLSLGKRDDPLSQTRALFARLREFDDLGVSVVLAEAVPAVGVGNAVMNRLFRAAGGKVVEV